VGLRKSNTHCYKVYEVMVLLSRHQNASQIQDIEIANRSFENVSQFKYLGMTVTNQNWTQEEIKEEIEFG
jgi:hypothetical protein